MVFSLEAFGAQFETRTQIGVYAAMWHIDYETLKPVITDEAEFRREHAADPLLDEIVLLWIGQPQQALHGIRDFLSRHPESKRARALMADALRDLNDFAGATEIYTELVRAAKHPLEAATYTQHLGKVYFCCGDIAQAKECFQRALDCRISNNAPQDLIDSSQLAVNRVDELLDGSKS
ncbi:hypothetical protein EII31_03755 [Leucobacter sp. OH2974_COT-288]|nr:hypothetical protein EII31_03755 [Leucobacter sp. OH2974_COT-288]